MGTGFCVNASFHFSRMNAPKCNFWSYGCYITFKETVNLFSGWLCHLLPHQQWMRDPVSSPFHQYLVVSLCFISVVLTVIPNERLLTVVPICIHPMTNDVESSASLLRSFRCCLYVLDSHPLLDRLVCIYFLPVFSLYFHPFNRVFSEHKVFCFCFFPLIKFSLSICPSKNHAFAVKSRLPSGLHGRCRGETHWASSTDESPGSVLGSSYSSRPEC